MCRSIRRLAPALGPRLSTLWEGAALPSGDHAGARLSLHIPNCRAYSRHSCLRFEVCDSIAEYRNGPR